MPHTPPDEALDLSHPTPAGPAVPTPSNHESAAEADVNEEHITTSEKSGIATTTEIEPTGKSRKKKKTGQRKSKPKRTFIQMIKEHPRQEAAPGFRVREVTKRLYIAAETLNEVLHQPERLSLRNIIGLAELLNEDPRQIVNDLIEELEYRMVNGELPLPPKSRTQRAANQRAGQKADKKGKNKKEIPATKTSTKQPAAGVPVEPSSEPTADLT